MSKSEHFAFWGFFAIAGAVWLFTPLIVPWMAKIFFPAVDLEHYAYFGDMYGAVNALFSAGALAGAIFAVLLQGKELQQTREELKSSAEAQQTLANLQALTAMVEYKWATYREAMQHAQDLKAKQNLTGDKDDVLVNAFSFMWEAHLEDYLGYGKRLEELLEKISGESPPSSESKKRHDAILNELLKKRDSHQ